MRSDRIRVLLLALVLAPHQALAHGSLAAFKPFWSGVFHGLMSPASVGAVVVFVCIAARRRDDRVLYQAVLAGILATAAVVFAPPGFARWAPLILAAIGLVGVAGRVLPPAATHLLAMASGVVAGTMAEVDERSWAAAAGVGFLIAYLGLVCVSILWALERRSTWVPIVAIGRRVASAWISAIALLLSALTMRGA